MSKFKREGKIISLETREGWVKVKEYATEDEAKQFIKEDKEKARKFKILQKELFVPREIQGLFGPKGGLQDVNIETKKMEEFRKEVYKSRRKIFTQLMREQIEQGKSKDLAFDGAYRRFIDVADEKELTLTLRSFQELYPDEKRQKSSW